MKTVERSSRLAVYVLPTLLVGALLVLVPTQDVAAQAAGGGGPKHDFVPPGWRIKHDVPPGPPWKHDKHDGPPWGPPCEPEERPCPPGQLLKHDLVPPPGQRSAEAQSATPSGLLEDLLSAAGTAELPVRAPVPPQAQLNLYWALVQGAPPELTSLVGALCAEGNKEAWREAVALVAAMQWLPYGDEYLPYATEAFNAFVEASSETFLRGPAPEFLVVHTFLGTLVDEAVSGGERAGDAF